MALGLDDRPLWISRGGLQMLGVRREIHYQSRIPKTGPLVVISNHRSFLDALLLMDALDRPVHFACHHYMGQVPGLRELVESLGCFPLASPRQRLRSLTIQGGEFLRQGQTVGIFPEGAQAMIHTQSARFMYPFQRGFAHLALRSPVPVTVLPVAIVTLEEAQGVEFPVQMLSWFDPSEPLFRQTHWHPAILYRHSQLRIGTPQTITAQHQAQYLQPGGKTLADNLNDTCQREIELLLNL